MALLKKPLSDNEPMRSDFIFLRIITCLMLFALSEPSAAQTSGSDEIGQLIESVSSLNKSDPSLCPPKASPFAKMSSAPAPSTSPIQGETATIKDVNGNDIQVSVVSEERAQELFKLVKQQNLALRNYRLCAQRAMIIGFTLDQAGIKSGKLIAQPGWFGSIVPDWEDNQDGHIYWKYHTAPFIYVRHGDKIEPMVFDPAAFDKPVSQESWEKFLKNNPNSSYSGTSIVSQYIYTPRSMDKDLKAFNPNNIIESRQLLDEGRASKYFQR